MERLAIWEKHGRSSNKAAEELGINRRTMDAFLDRYAPNEKAQPTFGQLDQTKIFKHSLPEEGTHKTYLITCAQNNTKIHKGFLQNLEAYAAATDAQIMVSTFVYQKNKVNTKNEKGEKVRKVEEVYYDPAILPYICDDISLLAPTLAHCGNLQISPTAVNPCSGFNDYTGAASSIIPHTKVQMRPVGTPRGTDTKHLYTTGAITLKNYIQAKAGQKAEFHHTFGALVVEVLSDGSWFVRQITADRNGSFIDLDKKVKKGKVSAAPRPEGIHWGDIHEKNIDPIIKEMFWAKGGVLDALKPKHQLFHDLVDGESHNHHASSDHHHQFALHTKGRRNVKQEFDDARVFIDEYAYRPWCKGVVVWSNHDDFLVKWLRGTDYKNDHENALFILALELVTYQAIRDGTKPSVFKAALNSENCTVLTNDDGGFMIAGIECDFHGNNGVGGSRGSVQQFANAGLKTSTGHSHAAWIIAGASSAGTCSALYLGYNHGLSTWSHTFTAIHQGGKRQQITANIKTGKWRA